MTSDEEATQSAESAGLAARLAEAVDHASAAETACRRIDTAMKAGFENLDLRFARATTSLSDRIRDLERVLGDRQRESDAHLAAAIRQARRGMLLMTFLAILAALAAIAAAAFRLS
ncbi:MAG: hypothetical protein MUE73_14800 [Planctomycetes bacterium]|jgi:hypothetical protein|nr:hypothetical protein [Planctomycetota bacterium]